MAGQETKRREKTAPDGQNNRGNNRDRILEASLDLFNERGSVAVSTKTIAAHIGISPGNFYYHFTDKEQVIRELYSRLQTHITPPDIPQDGSLLPPESLTSFLIAIIDNGWRYRFVNRDIDELVANDPQLAVSFRSDVELGRRGILDHLDSLIEHGVLSVSRAHRSLDYICANIQVQLLNWTRFLSTVRGKTSITKRDIADGALHAFVMLQPYLDRTYTEQVRSGLERRVRGTEALD